MLSTHFFNVQSTLFIVLLLPLNSSCDDESLARKPKPGRTKNRPRGNFYALTKKVGTQMDATTTTTVRGPTIMLANLNYLVK